MKTRNISYIVEVGDINNPFGGGYYMTYPSAKQARNNALAECKKTDLPVYVSFFRVEDGQHGYLNPDGSHSITGGNWNV